MPFLIIPILIATAFLPALIWLLFFLREDVHPEPTKLIIRTFLIGALATVPALALQIIFRETIAKPNPILIFIGLALIEETVKLGAAKNAVGKSKFFDEPIDAMVYMVAAASGFATVENILIAVGSLDALAPSALLGATNVLLLRFVGATLLHILSSAIIGYYWAKARKLKNKGGLIVYGVVLSALTHALFNHLVATVPNNNLLYSSLILIVAAFFVLNDFEILRKTNV